MRCWAWFLPLFLFWPVGSEQPPLLLRARRLFSPVPTRMDGSRPAPTPAQIDLGRVLFYEKQLSQNNTMSCNSCHDLRFGYGADGRPTSPGAVSGRGTRNAPTVYHAALHQSQFWDGRSPDVEDQAQFPVLNVVEMAMPSPAEVEKRLRASLEYEKLFRAAFPQDPNPVRWPRVLQAIGAFERGLVTPSPFDRYLEGEEQVLDSSQSRGLEHFLRLGCADCHNGPALGGLNLHKLGRKQPFASQDRGRFTVTHKASDDGVFKVPSLRNVCETAPYFHDGGVRKLEEAVGLMAKHECGQNLTPQQLGELCDFLTSLTGQIPLDYVRSP